MCTFPWLGLTLTQPLYPQLKFGIERSINLKSNSYLGPAPTFAHALMGIVQDSTVLQVNKWVDITLKLRGVNSRKVMWAFSNINVFLLIYFKLLYSYFSFAVPLPLNSSSCRLQGQFHLNGMQKAGDVVLGGLFKVHFFSVFSDLSFTSEPKQPTCHGWVWGKNYQIY